jgi:hypothetical protein
MSTQFTWLLEEEAVTKHLQLPLSSAENRQDSEDEGQELPRPDRQETGKPCGWQAGRKQAAPDRVLCIQRRKFPGEGTAESFKHR